MSRISVEHSLNQALVFGRRLEFQADGLAIATHLEHPNTRIRGVLRGVDFSDAAKPSGRWNSATANVAVLEILAEHDGHGMVEHDIFEFHCSVSVMINELHAQFAARFDFEPVSILRDNAVLFHGAEASERRRKELVEQMLDHRRSCVDAQIASVRQDVIAVAVVAVATVFREAEALGGNRNELAEVEANVVLHATECGEVFINVKNYLSLTWPFPSSFSTSYPNGLPKRNQ